MKNQLLMAHEVAKILDRSAQSVRAYEEQGLLPAERTPRGVRLFREDDVREFAKTLHNRTSRKHRE